MSLKSNPNLKSVAVRVFFSDAALTYLHDHCFVKGLPVYSDVVKNNRGAYFKRDKTDSFTMFLKNYNNLTGVKIKSGSKKVVFSTRTEESSPTTDIVFWVAKDTRLKIGAINGIRPDRVHSEVFLTVNRKCNNIVGELSYTKDHSALVVNYYDVSP